MCWCCCRGIEGRDVNCFCHTNFHDTPSTHTRALPSSGATAPKKVALKCSCAIHSLSGERAVAVAGYYYSYMHKLKCDSSDCHLLVPVVIMPLIPITVRGNRRSMSPPDINPNNKEARYLWGVYGVFFASPRKPDTEARADAPISADAVPPTNPTPHTRSTTDRKDTTATFGDLSKTPHPARTSTHPVNPICHATVEARGMK